MFTIECDNCGGDLYIDGVATFDSYMSDVNYLVDETGSIVEKSLQQFLVYKCQICGSSYKFTYREWEKRYREKIAREVMEVRKQHMFSTVINPQMIDPDNGIEFCGKCSGYFGDGTCLVDVIKQCTILRDHKYV